MSQRFTPVSLFGLSLVCLAPFAQADEIARYQNSDASLDCAGLYAQKTQLAQTIEAGDPNSPSFGKAAAGAAANTGGQLAGAVVAQSSGLFGALGGLVSKAAGAVAQQQVQEKMGPSEEAKKLAAQAAARDGFLSSLAIAKECRKDDPSFAGKPISPEALQQLASGETSPLRPMGAELVGRLSEQLTPLDAAPVLEGAIKVAGKRVYLSEFRVLFEVSGEASANTRAGYMPGGTSYGATNSRVKFALAKPDISAFQAITDQAYKDLRQRMESKGVKLEEAEAITSASGAVYATTEAASTAEQPVYEEVNLGHVKRKYVVMAPTGMKLHSRGFAGIGAGNIGTRMDYMKSKLDAVSIGVAVNFAALESSGSGSSILNRDGSSTSASEGMSLSSPPASPIAQGHVDVGGLQMSKPLPIPGAFARFKEVGGFDSQKNSAVVGLQLLGNLAGMAGNKSKTVELEAELDGPATTRMVLQGLASFNNAVAQKFQAGM